MPNAILIVGCNVCVWKKEGGMRRSPQVSWYITCYTVRGAHSSPVRTRSHIQCPTRSLIYIYSTTLCSRHSSLYTCTCALYSTREVCEEHVTRNGDLLKDATLPTHIPLSWIGGICILVMTSRPVMGGAVGIYTCQGVFNAQPDSIHVYAFEDYSLVFHIPSRLLKACGYFPHKLVIYFVILLCSI